MKEKHIPDEPMTWGRNYYKNSH